MEQKMNLNVELNSIKDLPEKYLVGKLTYFENDFSREQSKESEECFWVLNQIYWLMTNSYQHVNFGVHEETVKNFLEYLVFERKMFDSTILRCFKTN